MLPNFGLMRIFSHSVSRPINPGLFFNGTRNSASIPTVETQDLREIPPYNEDAVTVSNQFDRLNHVMIPLWKMPYKDQLKEKYRWSQVVVERIREKLKGQRVALSPKIQNTKQSPVTQEYRNKDECSVWTGADGDPKTIGFFVGSVAAKNAVCVPGTHLISMKQIHKEIAQKLEQYIRTSELSTCFDFVPGGGNWRRFLIRSNEKGDTLAAVICHPQSVSQERLLEEQERLKEFFTLGPGKDSCPTSLYFQACPHVKCTQEQAPFTLLHGERFFQEQLLGKTFRISPESFFQVNTKAAEVLYETVLKQANMTSRTTLLDICCGVGPISILAADHVRGCIGIEYSRASVKDAKYNAKINNTTNVDFFYGLAQEKIENVLECLDLASDIVAVLNPGRAGLEPRTIKALNDCPQIATVVYVSCKADMPSTLKNFVQLITSGQFTLKSVIPVDLFPHTWHTELVLTFKR